MGAKQSAFPLASKISIQNSGTLSAVRAALEQLHFINVK
jgi:hypothetical protein